MTTPELTETASQHTPLPIVITAAGKENLLLRALARQALPILRYPQDTSEADRLCLAQTLEYALRRDYEDNADEEDDNGPDAPTSDLPHPANTCLCACTCGRLYACDSIDDGVAWSDGDEDADAENPFADFDTADTSSEEDEHSDEPTHGEPNDPREGE